jgi:hypothetical protein
MSRHRRRRSSDVVSRNFVSTIPKMTFCRVFRKPRSARRAGLRLREH